MTPVRLQNAQEAYVRAREERVDAIADALEQGWTHRAIAEAMGLSKSWIGEVALSLGERRWVRKP